MRRGEVPLLISVYVSAPTITLGLLKAQAASNMHLQKGLTLFISFCRNRLAPGYRTWINAWYMYGPHRARILDTYLPRSNRTHRLPPSSLLLFDFATRLCESFPVHAFKWGYRKFFGSLADIVRDQRRLCYSCPQRQDMYERGVRPWFEVGLSEPAKVKLLHPC